MSRKLFARRIIGRQLVMASLLLLTALATSVAQARSFPEFTDLVKNASPAVVNISATQAAPARGQREEQRGKEMPDFFKRYFGDQQRRARPVAGSGFIVSADGYILTNNHVVENATEILVALSDRRQRVAVLVGADPASDLALLKIDATDLPTVAIGHSESLEVGEWVVAIGSPFGFEHSVTAGIVSAKGRSLPDEQASYVPYIQTDVAINPGNSGGPLFNLDGKVVGINSQIFTRSGGFMGLSFAIPIDVAMEVVEQLKEKGHVSRGWLGVLIQEVDRDLAESFGLERAAGALITEILQDSPAEASELEEGDIIVSFNGKRVDLSSDLPHIVGRVTPESLIEVEVYRGGSRKKLKVRVGLLPESPRQNASLPTYLFDNRLHMKVDELSPEQQEALGVKRGVLVADLEPGPAQIADIRKGDVITAVDGEAMTSVKVFDRKIKNLPANEAVHVRIIRNGRPAFLVIKITE